MLSSFNEFYRQRKIYFKIIFTTISILGVILILFSFFLAGRIKNTVEKELTSTNKLYLQQIVDSMDIHFDQIDKNVQQLIFDPVLDDYINFSRGEYYENIKCNFTESEEPYLYKYINLKKEIKNKLNFFKLSHEFVDSVYYYDIKKNIIFTDKEKQSKFQDFYDQGWKTLMDDKKKISTKICINNRSFLDDSKQYKNVVTFIYPLINHDTQNLFIVNVDASLFYKKFIKTNNLNNQSEIFVTVKDNIILHEDKSLFSKNINEVIQFKNEDKSKGNYNGHEVLVEYNNYNTLGWTFIYAVNIYNYQKIYQYIYSIIFIALILLFVVGIIAIIYFSAIIFKPLSSLVDKINHNNTNKDFELGNLKDKSEISLINSTLNTSYKENDKLKKSINKSMPFYRYSFLYSLLSSNGIEQDIEQLLWQKEFLNIEIDLNKLILVCWEVCLDGDSSSDFSDKHLRLTHIYEDIDKKINRIFNQHRKYTTIEISLAKVICLVNCEKGEINDILCTLETIKKEIEIETGFTFNLIISKFCEERKDIAKAYEEIQEISWQNEFYNKNGIKYMGDLSFYKTNLINYPKDIECELLGYIKTGDSEQAEKSFLKFMKYLTLYNDNVSQSYFRMVLFRLISALLNVINDYEINIEDVLDNENDFYKIIFTGDIKAVWLCKNLINKLAEVIRDTILINKNDHVKEILSIIENRYREDIYLGEIAKQLNLSESYISRLFKGKTEKTFKEYLTWYRIERAKELLTSTNKSISEISKDVGYVNNNYFIKVFKGMTDITPGDFRKGFNENAK